MCALILSPLLNWNIIVMEGGKCFEEELEEYCCDDDDDDVEHFEGDNDGDADGDDEDDDEDHLEGDIRVRHGR